MTCGNMMITEVYTVPAGMTVRAALKELQRRHVRSMPVIDGEGEYLGMFRFREMVRRVLPSSAGIPGGLQSLSFMADDVQALADKLGALEKHAVEEVMCTTLPALSPGSPFEEGFLQSYLHDSPLPVVGADGKLLGIFSKQRAMMELIKRIKE